MGTDHTYRYVNATNVYNKGKADALFYRKTTKTTADNVPQDITYNTGISSIKCIILINGRYSSIGQGVAYVAVHHLESCQHAVGSSATIYPDHYYRGVFYGDINAPWAGYNGTYRFSYFNSSTPSYGNIAIVSISGSSITIRFDGYKGAPIWVYVIGQ